MSSNSRNWDKRPLTVERSERIEGRRMYQQHLADEREQANRQQNAYSFVRRMRNLEEQWGTSWVQTREECNDPYGTPCDVMSEWMEEERFVKDLHKSKGCTKKEMDAYLVRLSSIYPAKVKAYEDGLWHTWLAFREAQRTGLYDDDQKLYAEMLQKLEQEDQREEAYALHRFDTDTDVQRLIELEKERERYMLEEYSVNLANPGYETWNNRWSWT